MAKMVKNFLRPEFMVRVDDQTCVKCQRCVRDCSFEALSFKDGVIPDNEKCTGCLRCMAVCPADAILVGRYPADYRINANWSWGHLQSIRKQAISGGQVLASTGNDKPYPIIWDHLLLDAAQVTNPSIDPLREPMELRTYLGRKPDSVTLDSSGELSQPTESEPHLRLNLPIMFGAMSYGAVSLNVQKALAKAAAGLGTFMNIGEGGLHQDLLPYHEHIIGQVASGRFGVNAEYLGTVAAIEIKIGQGAKPGIGGHLPGEKVTDGVAETRMIPTGSDAISPAPHHDIYSIEDLQQLIYAIKEVTNYEKPVAVKIAAVHNVAAIASGVVRAGADIVSIDGFRGGTGAAPAIIRDHVGIPIELALAAVDDRLREEGIRHQASIVASGSIRSAADVLKAIALGADAVYIATAALVAIGCTLCGRCHTGRCAWGITTQKPELVKRVDPDEAADLLKNLIWGWGIEIKETLGALGINSIESLRGNRERLRSIGLDSITGEILGVNPAGR